MEIIQSIQTRIYEIRGQRVMLDFDLAQLYDVETKRLNEAVKRNGKRFPEDFMFRLSIAEWEATRSQAEAASKSSSSVSSQNVTTSKAANSTWSQIATTSQQSRRKDSTPYAFTEQGVAMLSGILNSDKAINMNIAIMRAFVEIRRLAMAQPHLNTPLQELAQRISEHDLQLSQIYEALENMLDEKPAQRTWDNRDRIGFKPTGNP
jgi:hypothetical protein